MVGISGATSVFRICPLYANLPPPEPLKAFAAAGTTDYGTPVRKVILATNIAETSITIPGIKYVIDCGLQKMRVFRAASGIDSL